MKSEQELIAEREARDPLPYAGSLESFTCFCQREHKASAEDIRCPCGRTWRRLELSRPIIAT